MTGAQLLFSRAKLLRFVFLSLMLGFGAWLIAGGSDADLMQHGCLLRLLGPEGARWFGRIVLASCLIIALGAVRRMLGSRLAAAIRKDGIQFNSLFVSRFIVWHDLDRVRLQQWRTRRGGRRTAVRVETASGAHIIVTSILSASEAEIADWIRRANDSHVNALAPRRLDTPALVRRTFGLASGRR